MTDLSSTPSRLLTSSSSNKPRSTARPPESPATKSPPDTPADLSKLRAYTACRHCRLKKIKCLPGSSNNVPTNGPPGPCQQCSQNGIECTFPPTRDRAAYSRQYVQNLEARVQALEMVQGRMMPLLLDYETKHPNGSVFRVESERKTAINTHMTVEPITANGFTSNSPSPSTEDIGQITRDERGNYRWIGSSNTFSLLDSFAHHSPAHPSPPQSDAPHDNPYFGPVAGSGVVKALPGVDEVSYPTLQAAGEMVDAFFAEVHPCLPIIIEHDFRLGFKRIMDKRASHQPQESGGVRSSC